MSYPDHTPFQHTLHNRQKTFHNKASNKNYPFLLTNLLYICKVQFYKSVCHRSYNRNCQSILMKLCTVYETQKVRSNSLGSESDQAYRWHVRYSLDITKRRSYMYMTDRNSRKLSHFDYESATNLCLALRDLDNHRCQCRQNCMIHCWKLKQEHTPIHRCFRIK